MRKKLIEVALPLEAVNRESALEKSPRIGHPSTLHLWWARRPLAACRAVLFASLVDDPSSHPEQFPTEESQDKERQRLFRIIEELVKWENSNNETVLNAAREEILKSTDGHPPPVLDPFCGGGSIPLEAQRLGLEAHASDLNPVAVLITKALIEIPPKFAGRPPVSPEARKKLDHSKTWRGAQGLAEDVRYYGQWMRDEAEKRIGHLYPKVKLPPGSAGILPANAAKMAALPEAKMAALPGAPPAGWHSRGYLPHFEGGSIPQSVMFRLAGSLPQEVLERWENELATMPEEDASRERRRRIEDYLDSGTGPTWLRQPDVARLVEEALLHFDGDRYLMHAWVVMPNHVHALFTPCPGCTLSELLHSWKSYTANQANRMLGRAGQFWQEEYFDRYIRSAEHFAVVVDYVKAGLCASPEEWEFGSARRRVAGSGSAGILPASAANAAKMAALPGALPEATVIAWLWARTVKCPNPACGAQMPLVRSFWLSTKAGKKAWVEPVVDKRAKTVRFEVRTGSGLPPDPPKVGRGAKFRCLVCEQPVEDQHIKDEGSAKRMGAQLMAIVAEGKTGRVYVPPTPNQEATAAKAFPKWAPEEELPYEPRAIWCTLYGLKTYRDLFTLRQLVALTTFSDLVSEARERVLADARKAGTTDDNKPLHEGGTGTTAYADSVVMYLGMGVSRLANRSSVLCFWDTGGEKIQQVFARQAMPMTWDFAECNPFSGSSGNFIGQIHYLAAVIENSPWQSLSGFARQLDATSARNGASQPFIFTDPPYYDNIGYADLSDFFYVWLRRSLGGTFPSLFSTLLTPKAEELIASPYRFDGDKEKARQFFENGFRKAFSHLLHAQHPNFPLVLFYAFRQAETEEAGERGGEEVFGATSTGWETMLEGLLKAGFSVTGTWPMRTELVAALKKRVGALASSIVLVCRPRSSDAPLATRREFVTALKNDLPNALKNLQHGNIAPVDLAQAAIGPGMSVFSRYSKVVEADGSPMRVRTALALINQTLDEVLAEQEGEFDADTRWALAWFEQYGMNEGPFGVAETLSKAKNTSVDGMKEAGVAVAKAGKVRLVRRDELPAEWDPATDRRLTVWEVTQYFVQALERSGEKAPADLLRKLGSVGEVARDLAYRLYSISDRKKWSREALAYNSLVVAWPEITRLARSERPRGEQLPLG